MIELLLVTVRAPAGVIPVLLASAGVVSGRLKVAARADANPHVLIGGRNSEAANAGEMDSFPDSLAVGIEIEEAAATALASNTGIPVGGKEKSFGGHRLEGVDLALGRLGGVGG